MFVSTGDIHESSYGPHGGSLQLVLLLVFLLHRVGLDLRGAGQFERLHQPVKLLKYSAGAKLTYSEEKGRYLMNLSIGMYYLATIR